MKFNGTQIQFNTKWTRFLALCISILYLTNPIHRPINFALHQILVVFESPNKVMGHEKILIEYDTKSFDHEHDLMQLESGHTIIDLVTQFFKTSNEQESSNESLQKIVKIDKHVVTYTYKLQSFEIINYLNNFWSLKQKSVKGYLLKYIKPPRLL